MSTPADPPPPACPDELPRWTLERMDLFIRTLRRTGNVAAAARAAGMSRQAAYRLRARLPGHPFDRAWAAAMAPREAFRRMISGDAGGARRSGHRVSQGVTPGNAG